MDKIKSFDEYWDSVKPDIDPEDKTAARMVEMQKAAAQSGWQGAMMQVIKFIEFARVK